MRDTRHLLDAIDAARRNAGFLSLAETLALSESGNTVLDPFSTLISRDVEIGESNVIHPNVRLDCRDGAALRVGSGNVLHANTVMEATDGAIIVGDGNLFGEGVLTVKANAPGARIEIGDGGRYVGIVNVYGQVTLGSGSQVLGTITVQGCTLAAGAPHSHPEPDARGAVLKGAGSARDIHLAQGQVIDGWGRFQAEDAVTQSTFHPAPAPGQH